MSTTPGGRPDLAAMASLTAAGSGVLQSAQSAIRRREEQILARLPPGDRTAFLRSLQALSELPPDAMRG